MSAETDGVKMGLSPMTRQHIEKTIIRARKCSAELSQIADDLAKLTFATADFFTDEIDMCANDDAKRVVELLAEKGVGVEVSKVHKGPTFNKIELTLPLGCRYSSVTGLEDGLRTVLKQRCIRIEAPIPGYETVGIEYSCEQVKPVTFSDTVLPELRQLDAQSVCPALPIVLGRDVDCKAVSFDLAVMPHLLVAGAMGQGTSMFIQSAIAGLIAARSPEQMRLILFDPKGDCSDAFESNPHLQVPVIRKNNRIIFAFNWAIAEIENRLKLFAKVNVRTIQEFNARSIDEGNQHGEIPATVPYIVIVLNEFAELMLECGEEATACLLRLSMKGRSAGVHLILATQCLTYEVITGTIKANVMGRIAFKTSTSLESRIILDDAGAECLSGNGDCLYLGSDGILQRVQTPEMSIADIAKFVENGKERCSAGGYLRGESAD